MDKLKVVTIADFTIWENHTNQENPKYEYYISYEETPDDRTYLFGVNTRFDVSDFWALYFNGWFDDIMSEITPPDSEEFDDEI